MEEKGKVLRGLSHLQPSLDKLTLGVTRILEASPGVTEVVFVEKEPAERHAIVSWEQKNACVLPEDLKNFYLMTDGFHLTWSVNVDDNPMPLGSMTINSIAKLSRLGGSPAYSLPNAPTLADLEEADDEGGNEDDPPKPHLDSRSLIFELDPCGGNGKVCLVYKNTKPVVTPDSEIWFLDRALYWHFLTKTFTAYYRLLITHLGLPQWQYAYTSYGISPQAKQWFNMYKPITLNTKQLSEEADSFVNKLDPNKVFRSKNKTPVLKKKELPSQQLPPPQKGQTGGGPKNPSQAAGSSRRREAQS
uniref:Tubulin polyglutamylase complex subunit 2 n=1 Tax=Salvator merianae TaxID=96440 RepID=A0A8D0B1N1_SALMN